MCGIAGIVRPAGTAKHDLRTVNLMLKSMSHRGPDGEGSRALAKCVLGQNRLALIDLSKISLPLLNNRRNLTLVFNGEIYNHKELRTELSKGYDFETQTDSEIVLAAFERWGSACVHKFDGMFSFFIWNDLTQEGFAARDRMGVKPFFFCYKSDHHFAFASEAAPLVQSGLQSFKANDEYLMEYFTTPYFSGAKSTPYSEIQVLLPGETLHITLDGLRREQYFSYQFEGSNSHNQIDWQNLLKNAVQKQLMADTEIGLFLSGGLDSTLLAALAHKKLKTWTIRYEGQNDSDYEKSLILKSDDFKFAIQASKELGHEFHDVNVQKDQYSILLAQTLQQNDLISAWEQEVSQFALAQAAAQHVKAVLVGDAADETHFGYPFLLRSDIVNSPRNVIQFFGHVPLNSKLIDNQVEHFTKVYKEHSEKNGYSWDKLTDQRLAMSKLVADFWLVRLLHNGDTHTMAHSVEARVPFTDNEMLMHASKLLPQEGLEKSHLRNVAAKYVSAELAYRPKSALTKYLKSQNLIHSLFVTEWQKYGELFESILDSNTIDAWTKRESHTLSDRDTGLEFRILSAMTWRKRFL